MFLEEAVDLLDMWEQSLQTLEDGFDEEALNQLFRAAHSLKGSGKSVGLDEFGGFVHHAEDILSQVKEDPELWEEETAELFADLHSFLCSWRDSLEKEPQKTPSALSSWTTRIEVARKGLIGPSSNDSFGGDDGIVWVEENLPKQSRSTEQEEDQTSGANGMSLPQPEQRTQEKETTANGVKTTGDATIRVRLDALDLMSRTLGELTVAGEILNSIKKVDGDLNTEIVRRTIDDLVRLTESAHQNVLSMQLTPLDTLFPRLKKICLDTARKLNKDVEVHLIGSDIELDKVILEKMKDPLVHIVRNAVDHGVEGPHDRQSLGKKPTAKITIEAIVHGTSVVIRVSDDGRGLDSEKIEKKAIAKGILSPGEGPAESDIFALIMRPGFSTAETVSDISGRGVGMDVVRTAIEELGGTIQIHSKKGQGSTFEVHLPSSVNIIDSLIASAGSHIFALPMESVDEVFLVRDQNLTHLQGGDSALQRPEETIPLFRLSKSLGAEVPDHADTTGVVVTTAQGRRALTFSSIIGQQPIFLRPTYGKLRDRSEFLGCAVLASGEPTFVINFNQLLGAQHVASKAA